MNNSNNSVAWLVKVGLAWLVLGSLAISWRNLSSAFSSSSSNIAGSMFHNNQDGNNNNNNPSLPEISQQIEKLQQHLEKLETLIQNNHNKLQQTLAEAHSLRGAVVVDDDNTASAASSIHTAAHDAAENDVHKSHDDDDFGDLTDLYRRFRYQKRQPHSPSHDAAQALCGDAPEYATWFNGTQGNSRSVNNEDAVVYSQFFKDMTSVVLPAGYSPTYLELGAYNGKTESNTRFFDVCLGWNGLLVEANPHPNVWNQLIENRPTAHRMHFAASCSHHAAVHDNATIPFYATIWTNAAQTGTNNSYTGTVHKPVDVPCGSLTPFIQDLLGGHVTFFSLDVEGAEPMVLEQIDFDKVRADVMIIENRNAHCGEECVSRDKFRALMDRAGYIRPTQQIVQKSDLYVHPQSPFAKLIN